ncbi:MAG: hypothetical protein NUW23_14870 [Firmicutes bacterium]|nr:hypothetical protein [Bacillota bacterium]
MSQDWDEIRTEFVRERLKETTWENRSRIAALMALEEYVRRQQIGEHISCVDGWYYTRVAREFPVEYECIKREMEEGVLTSFAEFIDMQAEHDRKVEQSRMESEERASREREEERRKEAESRKKWRQMGGKD